MTQGTTTRPAIVIGSGFGGLAAAVRLRAMGHRVVVLEARDQFGGRAGVFERSGYIFDAGPTVITAPYLFDELFELVGRRREEYFELMPVDPFYRISFPDGEHFDYVGDRGRLLAEIERFNPSDVDGYLQLFDHAEEIFEIGYQQLADVPFDSPFDMLRIAPHMIRLQNYRSVYGLVSKYIDDERLRRVFTFQPLLVGGNPFDVTSIYLLIHVLEQKWGVHFARGGTAAIIAGLVELLEEIGVELRANTPVVDIEVRDGRAVAVRTEGGERLAARCVVSNADPSFVYKHMIEACHRRKHTDRRIERVKQSMGLFVGYFGTDRIYPDVEHHTIVMGPRYKGLLDDIFNHKVLPDDFSLYLHRPTASDPSLAPEGHDAFYVLSPVPNNKSGIDWGERAEAYFSQILAHLEERHLPGLSDHMTVEFCVTPDYFERELRSMAGAGFGPEPRLTQSAWFRYHNRCKEIDELYFVGAGVHPGAGVPGVLSSARVLEKIAPRPNSSSFASPSSTQGRASA